MRGYTWATTKSRGPASLVAGRNAAAKVRAVAALGCELGLDVFRIDLTHIVSSSIGETERNLRLAGVRWRKD